MHACCSWRQRVYISTEPAAHEECCRSIVHAVVTDQGWVGVQQYVEIALMIYSHILVDACSSSVHAPTLLLTNPHACNSCLPQLPLQPWKLLKSTAYNTVELMTSLPHVFAPCAPASQI